MTLWKHSIYEMWAWDTMTPKYYLVSERLDEHEAKTVDDLIVGRPRNPQWAVQFFGIDGLGKALDEMEKVVGHRPTVSFDSPQSPGPLPCKRWEKTVDA